MIFVPNETPSIKLGGAQHDIGSISAHPDGTLVAVCCQGVMHILAWPSLKAVAKSKDASSVAYYSADGALLVGKGACSIALHDPRKATVQREVSNFDPASTYGLALSPNGERVVVGVAFTAFVVDVASGAKLFELPVFDRTVNYVSWSHDGRLIATRSRKDVGVFDAAQGKRLAVVPGLTEKHAPLAFTPHGALVTPIDDNTLGVWAKDAWEKPAKRIATERPVHCVAVSSSGTIAINAKLSVQLLTPELEPLQTLEVSDAVSSLAFSPNGTALFAAVGPTVLAWSS
jgi:WD40 repeat protein